MIEALILFGVMCLCSWVVVTLADHDEPLDPWDDES
jgi:hypothetical protein